MSALIAPSPVEEAFLLGLLCRSIYAYPDAHQRTRKMKAMVETLPSCLQECCIKTATPMKPALQMRTFQ